MSESSSQTASTSILAPSDAAFRFVSRLGEELSQGRLDLPVLPEVVSRVRQVLADDNVSASVVARVVSTEPGLAARVLTLANSVIMNPSGVQVTELRSAITRIGYQNVRATSLAYAVSKLRQAGDLGAIRPRMESLWREALATASAAYAVAQDCQRRLHTAVNADEALLVGLTHNIGKLYILSRSHRYAQLFVSIEESEAIMRDWHTHVGKAIVESWGFAPHLVNAIADQQDAWADHTCRFGKQPMTLTDALALAVHLGDHVAPPVAAEVVPPLAELTRSNFDEQLLAAVVAVGGNVFQSLRAALGN